MVSMGQRRDEKGGNVGIWFLEPKVSKYEVVRHEKKKPGRVVYA